MIKFRLRNVGEVSRKIEAAMRAGGEANVSGVRVIAEEIMTDVKASRPGAGVPVDTGVLRASGRVEGPDSSGTVLLSFGGASAPYALRQHEELSYNHTVGEARYLIRGLERWQSGSKPEDPLREMNEAAIKAAKRA